MFWLDAQGSQSCCYGFRSRGLTQTLDQSAEALSSVVSKDLFNSSRTLE